MEIVISIIYFGSLVMSFIANIAYLSIVMPALHDMKEHRKAIGGQDIEIDKIALHAAYTVNRPLFLCGGLFSFLNFFIVYGNSLFFIVFAILASISVYQQSKSVMLVMLSAIFLFFLYRALSIIALMVVNRYVIKRRIR